MTSALSRPGYLSIAAHYCIDQQRKKRLPSIDLDEIIEYSAEDPAPNPESAAIKSEFTEDIQRQLSHLSEGDRAVLVLRYWHELSEDEICETLKITKSAVKSRLHRARDIWQINGQIHRKYCNGRKIS